ncbi:hypothetical protein PRIPAC_70375 [Pristionchus pacificus]|uniref:Uncharacterized protein n=1 Tax=Pristionchus pacificus TaxID=54126 RepID=A0A2A6C0I6_PRIPA|nr:hypothetical protein PRIPAC_70375 [Pristionchus pacificus]|eukprot:PDM71523.1 hypothetical protein PRIPAC_37930 [Pristionchus pacificus]
MLFTCCTIQVLSGPARKHNLHGWGSSRTGERDVVEPKRGADATIRELGIISTNASTGLLNIAEGAEAVEQSCRGRLKYLSIIIIIIIFYPGRTCCDTTVPSPMSDRSKGEGVRVRNSAFCFITVSGREERAAEDRRNSRQRRFRS